MQDESDSLPPPAEAPEAHSSDPQGPPALRREPSLVHALLQSALVFAPVALLLACSVRRRWMDDDGFINLRIVRNILEGYGPVFNAGERVEVYTSALWIGVLAFFGKLVPAPLEKIAVDVGIACTVLGLVFATLASLRAARTWQGSPGARLDRPVFGEGSWSLPLGAAVIAVLPPFWDYASSGLETGLAILWLGGSYLLLFQSLDGGKARTSWLTAVVLGLGPLIRPEFALYSLAFFLPLAWTEHARAAAAGTRRLVALAASAVAIPLAYQVFRMGYFGALTPNTAIAKEAFKLNAQQGLCYWRNFFGLYALAVPLPCLLVFWIARIRQKSGDLARRLALFTPPVLGLLHAGYVVAMGGDYMHGRMFLPPLFAMLLPVATVTLRAPRRGSLRSVVPVLIALPLLVWLPICGTQLRVAVENVCGIGDERGWYSRLANVPNPVLLEQYKNHVFHRQAVGMRVAVSAACPGVLEAKDGDACRKLVASDNEHVVLVPRQSVVPMAPGVAPDLFAAVPAKAIGITGYFLPSRVGVIDQLGLGDPFASRVQLKGRGRPGHEKELPYAWIVARLGAPHEGEDAAVAAARHAMSCDVLGELDQATHAPLDASLFFRNMARASRLTKLRIPKDPFDAEERFCHVPQAPRSRTRGGGGGSVYRWQCPKGSVLSGLSGSSTSKDEVGEIHALCTSPGAAAATISEGPAVGKASSEPFRAPCPDGTWVQRIEGTSGKVVQSLRLTCSDGTRLPVTKVDGPPVGVPFDDVACPDQARPVGILGRAGDLIDAIGLLCEPPSKER